MNACRPGKLYLNRRRGAAMIIALALILGLLLVVTAAQYQTMNQLSASKYERADDRALLMAEAGVNAYLNMLSNGAGSGSNSGYVPSSYTFTSIPTLAQFKVGVKNGTYTLIKYPSGQSRTGYFAGQVGTANASVTVVGFGWSDGVVRRVKVSGISFNIFDWAAVYAMDPYTNTASGPGLAANQNPNGTDTGNAWDFTGSANVVGGSGGEGYINGNNNVTWYDGPIILAANGNSLNPSGTFNPTVLQSTPNVPTGHSGTGTLASPMIRRFARSLNLETADSAANSWAKTAFNVTTTSGVEWFRTNQNNNSTGIKILVQVTTSGDPNYGKVRELATAYAIPTSGNGAWKFDASQPSSNTLKNTYGMTNNETFVGFRVYPGNYFVEQITQATGCALYLRTTNSASYIGVDGNGNSFPVYNSTFTTTTNANPNTTVSASENNIRFWIGNPSSGNSPNSTFSDNTFMEDPTYASRFRVYSATKGTLTVSGTNSSPPKKFRVNILSKNSIAGTGANAGKTVYYGTVSIASGTYLFGSLLGWQVKVAGGCTIEKQGVEAGGSGDKLTYLITGWTEEP